MAQQKMAQEKAVELFKKYYCLSNNSKSKLKVIEYETAKECAIIAVDEILKAVESDWIFMEKRKEYWKQVKKEIENL